MIGIKLEFDLGMIIEVAALILGEIITALSWWQWVLMFIVIAANVWVANDSKERAFRQEQEHQEMLNTLNLIDNQIKIMQSAKK